MHLRIPGTVSCRLPRSFVSTIISDEERDNVFWVSVSSGVASGRGGWGMSFHPSASGYCPRLLSSFLRGETWGYTLVNKKGGDTGW